MFGFTPILKLINLSRCSRGNLLWREVSFKQTADEKPINLPSSWNHGGNTGVKLANTIKGVVDPFERDAATMRPRLFLNGLPKLHAYLTRTFVAFSNVEMHTHQHLVKFCAKFFLLLFLFFVVIEINRKEYIYIFLYINLNLN